MANKKKYTRQENIARLEQSVNTLKKQRRELTAEYNKKNKGNQFDSKADKFTKIHRSSNKSTERYTSPDSHRSPMKSKTATKGAFSSQIKSKQETLDKLQRKLNTSQEDKDTFKRLNRQYKKQNQPSQQAMRFNDEGKTNALKSSYNHSKTKTYTGDFRKQPENTVYRRTKRTKRIEKRKGEYTRNRGTSYRGKAE